MSKQLFVDPVELRQKGEITFPVIPVNQYQKSVSDELTEGNFTPEELKKIYRDMFIIREFETMLNLVKTTGGYNGVEYNNPGPAHLSMGQEAAAVGISFEELCEKIYAGEMEDSKTVSAILAYKNKFL